MSEYISISAFAKRAGVSRQAVYARLDKDLCQYVKTVDSKKVVNDKAIELFIHQEKSCQVSTKRQVSSQANIDKYTSLLEGQLERANAQIDILTEQLAAVTKSLQFEQSRNAELQKLLAAPAQTDDEPVLGNAPAPANSDGQTQTNRRRLFDRLLRKSP